MSDRGTRECGVCWWVYDPAVGDDDAQVPAGVAFDDLPETYVCPRCHALKERFLRPPDDPVGRLVAAYRAVDVRMRGLPIHNPLLSVEAVGFRRVGDTFVGALITPWFLNLIVLGQALPREGDSVELAFPGGIFTALGAAPEGVRHLAVSLLSPVNELADQAAARAVADEALRLVLAPASVEPTPPPSPAEATPAAPKTLGRRGLFGGLLGT
jgi:[NiFe] hydrogenase assembly HybE family chaperone